MRDAFLYASFFAQRIWGVYAAMKFLMTKRCGLPVCPFWNLAFWLIRYLTTRVRDNIQKSKEQKNIQPTKGGHKMVTCQNYVSLFYCQITSCPSDGGIS